ncbi:hypothetical protein BROSI_A1474 [Candidatus Brocadia sinica JPN1]|uniref:Uncharacterized protein n=1 Tax=Candidatus Brocadia sinica JPN1 TaxID=1197129 RepID=A0ABQ0JWA0_9BACT|nr:hypothetical protein BROSI_A1474 [Candidatus Brocadia sinica JPN1]
MVSSSILNMIFTAEYAKDAGKTLKLKTCSRQVQELKFFLKNLCEFCALCGEMNYY